MPVHRVGRIEPWIVDAREDGTFDGMVQRFEEAVTPRAARPTAHRVQDDHRVPDRSRHHRPDRRGRRARPTTGGAPTTGARRREHAKPVRDFLLRRAFALAKAHDRVFHVHVGGGDPDVNLAHATPRDVF